MATATGMIDPLLRPLPPTPVSNNRQRSNLSHITLAEADESIHPPQRANSDTQKHGSAKGTEGNTQKPRRRRPLSWFPTSGTMSGRASHLLKDSTASTVERSIISPPVLTSTTNAKVAMTEGVQCGEMTASGLSTASWNPRSGWYSDSTGGDFAKDELYQDRELQSPCSQKTLPRPLSKERGEMPKRQSKRSASLNALSKVKDALTSGLRQASDPQTYRSVFSRDKFVRLGDDCRPSSPINDRLARIKTEGRNLGKDKIRMLTGHGRIKRKPVEYSEQDSHDTLIVGRNAFLVDADKTSDAGTHCRYQGEHALDFSFEDLESSFAKAVENLDFRIRRDKSSFTSLSSLFRSGRDASAPTQTRPPQSQQGPPPAAYPHFSSTENHPPPKSSPHPASDQLVSAKSSMGQCMSLPSKCCSGRAKPSTEVYSFPYQRDLSSNGEIDKGNRAALAERTFSRGHSNPLASHPDLTKFAEQPSPATIQPKIPSRRATPRADVTSKEHDLDGLEGAPIYSPSLETLSQYDRNTPSSAPGSTSTSSRKLLAATSQMPLLDTPTRPSRRGTDGRHKVARSHWNTTKPASNHALRIYDKQDKDDSPRSILKKPTDRIAGGSGHPSWILKAKDENTMLGAAWADDGSQNIPGIPAGSRGNFI
jgi:hypothetical protein